MDGWSSRAAITAAAAMTFAAIADQGTAIDALGLVGILAALVGSLSGYRRVVVIYAVVRYSPANLLKR